MLDNDWIPHATLNIQSWLSCEEMPDIYRTYEWFMIVMENHNRNVFMDRFYFWDGITE